MCGIIGISESNNNSQIEGGMQLIKHRGPDDKGIFSNNNVTFGHLRLSIIDLSVSGHQPMEVTNNNKVYTIIFNGEIYNYGDLKNDLIKKGSVFKGGSDTEVILRGYILEGKSFIEKLRGMWALAIYDGKKDEIVLSRDHFGIKPLYYTMEGDKLCFASEIKALKKISKTFTPNKEKYFEYFNLGYFVGESTCFKEVKKILPGQILTWDSKSKTLHKEFISLSSVEKNNELSFDQSVDLVENSIIDSVDKHFIADVEVGLLLSGGADSSLIAAISKKIGKKPICYHLSVPGSIDTKYSNMVADYLGFDLVQNELNPNSLSKEYQDMKNWIDLPTSDVSIIPTSLVYKSVNKINKVVLSGEGGDELFGGYLRHNYLANLDKVRNTNGILDTLYLNNSIGFSYINPVIRRIQENVAMLTNDLLTVYLHQTKTIAAPLSNKAIHKTLYKLYANHPYKDLVPANLFFDQFAYLPDSLMYKNDITSMASSIEARVPLVDVEVLKSSSIIPNKFRLSPEYKNKKILKTILSKYLPDTLVERPKKGFGFSFEKIDSNFFVDDYKEAASFHLSNALEFGVDQNLRELLSLSNTTLVCKKFPRFAFSIITNYLVMKKL